MGQLVHKWVRRITERLKVWTLYIPAIGTLVSILPTVSIRRIHLELSQLVPPSSSLDVPPPPKPHKARQVPRIRASFIK